MKNKTPVYGATRAGHRGVYSLSAYSLHVKATSIISREPAAVAAASYRQRYYVDYFTITT